MSLSFVKVKRIFFTISNTVCPRSSDPFYLVNYYNIKLVTTSWTKKLVEFVTFKAETYFYIFM